MGETSQLMTAQIDEQRAIADIVAGAKIWQLINP